MKTLRVLLIYFLSSFLYSQNGDVYVGKDFKDRLEGNSPQLDKAIEIIMKKI
ncbi:MAG: hypothetical protein HWD82_02990 [Flavobacteriaceae bacterium]|nr:hypothetical protein [Flavobacteriaceae bacterium]